MSTTVFGVRAVLRPLSVPAAIAYVLITTLTLLARVTAYAFALVAEVADRIADAGQAAREAAHEHGTTDLPEPAPFLHYRGTAHAYGGGR
ncbi:hypothetical protein [Umezawaea tangerina]|uniref:Uncharacterized protein n=1 Tax=Umezawaea tangerina TaxID=84725 RepID=A0A2T0SSB8_9PSEU|nr:hypothetical protein [Umezawaea tangerina]PRY36273.1 hypothetical protein CLV43_112200 [Umezawaea tangerina]